MFSFKLILNSKLHSNAYQHLDHSLIPTVTLTTNVSCPWTLLPLWHLLPFTLDDLFVSAAISLCLPAQEMAQHNGNTNVDNSMRHLVSDLIGPRCLIHQPSPILRCTEPVEPLVWTKVSTIKLLIVALFFFFRITILFSEYANEATYLLAPFWVSPLAA